MERYRAVVAYDGTDYQGFQRLPSDLPSVQGAIERALSHITGHAVSLVGAGRTDAGVHASGQVIAFEAEWRHGTDKLLRAANAELPPDIALQSVEIAAPTFHPRYSAVSRTYRYMVYSAEARNPLKARFAWHVWNPLDIEAMNAAAALLIGEHDFASFGTPPMGERDTHGTRRIVVRSRWAVEAGDDGTFSYLIEANAFLYHQVRATVAALVEVGIGRTSVQVFETAFKERKRMGRLAPPQGLTLIHVNYDEPTGS
jgi:tRNA pseudouridine38-40 synthase